MRRSPESSGWNAVTVMAPWRQSTGWPSTVAPTTTPGPDALDDRRPDEHRMERPAVETVDVEVGLERVALASVAVSPHRQVDRPERALVGAAVERLGGEQDHPRARAEHRQTAGEARREGVEQTGRLEQQRHGGRFTARHHERVDRGQVVPAHVPRWVRRRAQPGRDCGRRTRLAAPALRPSPGGLQLIAAAYQPRSASLTSSDAIS